MIIITKAPAGMIASNSKILSSSSPTAVTLTVGVAVTLGNVDVIVINIAVISFSIVASVVAVMLLVEGVVVVVVRILVVMATSSVDDVLVAATHYTKGYNE